MNEGFKQNCVVVVLLFAAFTMLLDAPSYSRYSRITNLQGTIARADVMHQLGLEQQLQNAKDIGNSKVIEQLEQELQDSQDAADDLCRMHSNPQLAGPELQSFNTKPSFPPVITLLASPSLLVNSDNESFARSIKPPPEWPDISQASILQASTEVSHRGPPAFS